MKLLRGLGHWGRFWHRIMVASSVGGVNERTVLFASTELFW
jgi:hypothetical protein